MFRRAHSWDSYYSLFVNIIRQRDSRSGAGSADSGGVVCNGSIGVVIKGDSDKNNND